MRNTLSTRTTIGAIALGAALGLLSACAGKATTAPVAMPVGETTASPKAIAEFGGVRLPKGHELLALQQNCQVCHSLDMVYTQRLSKKTWSAEVSKMIKFGAPLPKNDKAAVIAYLTKYLGPSVPRSEDRATALAPATTYSSAPAEQ